MTRLKGSTLCIQMKLTCRAGSVEKGRDLSGRIREVWNYVLSGHRGE